ncbi:MAG: hypothetical protein BWY96_03033 [Spirochaetes bacterium ADurb.BinA120]|nr:MAG: hypothetical protein BWY96_03033 [Spirochaetes bacterium ADurb.BinA120]
MQEADVRYFDTGGELALEAPLDPVGKPIRPGEAVLAVEKGLVFIAEKQVWVKPGV